MMHNPIQLHNLSLSFSHKTCFENVNAEIPYGSRIAIIGRNGSGKSSLLKLLYGAMTPTSGQIFLPDDACIAHVPQVIEELESLSGGERLNEKLTQALSLNPNILLLDEPTNHLDLNNRKSLMRMLNTFEGTLMVVSHDVQLLQQCMDTLWHIDQEKIHVFSGHYHDYLRELHLKRSHLEEELSHLEKQKKFMHDSLMKEQIRAAQSRKKGDKSISQRKWPTVVSHAKAHRAQETSNRKKSQIHHKKQAVLERLSQLSLAEIITPHFSLTAADISEKTIISIQDGSLSYGENCILDKLYFSMKSHDRVAITGDNGSGKSTLLHGMLNHPGVHQSGDWYTPNAADIAYLDQHYKTLDPALSLLDSIASIVPDWDITTIRRHLNDFLFRENEVVNMRVSSLSGGEKARLSLAQIAAKTPTLLILDEVTNNLDLETREHMIQVLSQYPGALILISHDQDFLHAIQVKEGYLIKGKKAIAIPL